MPQAPARSRSDRRKARTEAAILGAAEELFLANGFRDTRIEDIASAADVAVGSIYTHFGSKLRLYLSIVERALAEQETRFGAVYASDAGPGERLGALLEAYVCFVLSSPSHFLLLNEAAQIARVPGDDPAAPLVRDLADRGDALVTALERLVAEGVEAGVLRAVDPGRCARYLWASWTGVLALHLRRDRLGATTAAELRAIVEVGLDIATSGLRHQDGRPAPPSVRIDDTC